MPIVRNTIPFQNPRRDPVAPTVSNNGNDEKDGFANEATLFVVGATQTVSSARKKKSGMRTYCRKDSDERRGVCMRFDVETIRFGVTSRDSSVVECEVDASPSRPVRERMSGSVIAAAAGAVMGALLLELRW